LSKYIKKQYAVITLVAALIFVFAFAACAGRVTDQKAGEGQGSGPEPAIINDPTNAVYPDRNTGDWPLLEYGHPNLIDYGDTVAITYPKEMFEGVELSDLFFEFNDYVGGTKNGDGSVTIVMSKARQQMFLTSFRDDVNYNIEYFLSEIDYLKDFAFSDDMRYMDIYVDGSMDVEILYEMPYFFSLPFEQYQITLGQEVHSTMTVIDADTGKTIFTLIFPDVEK
jgi:hypothetical protein